MKIKKEDIEELNKSDADRHKNCFDSLARELSSKLVLVENLIDKIQSFQVTIPSWALGTGGTRFGRFSGAGEPASLHEKIEDIGLMHALNKSSDSVSLHIPWDIPEDPQGIKDLANSLGIRFDAVNSNTFQDQSEAAHSYKFGSLCHVDMNVRNQAIAHNKDVINHGVALGSKSLTVWLADGSSFPGQQNFARAFNNTLDSLKAIYDYLPEDWTMLVEYKPYEPNFYSMVISDWGTSHLLATKLGPKANCLVDLGHHLPNTNIEQIVGILLNEGKLGGFHFNDSKYGDDDLTVGSLKPYQLFLIFGELVRGVNNNPSLNMSWMIDASHNLKDPLEDLIQSVEAIQLAYAQALIVDWDALNEAQLTNDVTMCQEILQGAFRTDLRPLLAEARLRSNGAINPLKAYRALNVRKELIKKRGSKSISSGL